MLKCRLEDNHKTGMCRRSLSIEPGNEAIVPFWFSIVELELDVGMVELDVGMVAYTCANVDTIINEKIIMFMDKITKPSVALPLLIKFLFIKMINAVNR